MEGEQRKKTEVLVGLFLLIGILLLGALILQFSRLRDTFKPTYQIRVKFEDTSGLIKGAPVTFGGTKIGILKSKPLLKDPFGGVETVLEINDKYEIPVGSSFRIKGAGLMGDKMIEIKAPSNLTNQFLPKNIEEAIDGSGVSGIGGLEMAAEELTAQIAKVLMDIEVAVEKLTDSVESLNSGFLKEDNSENLKSFLEKIDSAAGKLDEKVLADDNIENVSNTFANFSDASNKVKDISTSLEPSIAKLEPLFDRLGSAGESLDSALAEFDTLADGINSLVKNVNEGDGMITSLIQDKSLKSDFRNLIANLRQNGVLRYRDSNRISEGDESNKKVSSVKDKTPASQRSRFPWSRKNR